MQVVLSDEGPGQWLAGREEVPKVGSGVATTHRARAARVERRRLFCVDATPEVDPADAGVGAPALRHRGGQDAIKEVHAAVYAFEEVEGGPDAHEVSWSARRKAFTDDSGLGLTLFARLPDGEPPDGVAVEAHVGERVRALAAELLVTRALHDREQGGPCVTSRRETRGGPKVGSFHGSVGLVVVRGGGDAVVEHHADVAAEG